MGQRERERARTPFAHNDVRESGVPLLDLYDLVYKPHDNAWVRGGSWENV